MTTAFPPSPAWPRARGAASIAAPWVLWAIGGAFVAGLVLAGTGGFLGTRIRRHDAMLRDRALLAGGAIAQQELFAERSCQRYLLTGDSDALVRLQEAEEGIQKAIATGAGLSHELAPWDPSLGVLLEKVREKLWSWRSAYSLPAIEYRLAGNWDALDQFNRREGQARWIADVDAAVRDYRAHLQSAVEARENSHRSRSTFAAYLLILGIVLQSLAILAAVPLAVRSVSANRDRNRLSRALKSFTDEIRDAMDEGRITDTIARAILRTGGMWHCNVLLPRGDGRGLRVRQAAGEQIPERRRSAILDNPELCPVMKAGRPHLVGNVRAERVCDCPLGVPFDGAYACIPLVVKGTAYGLANAQAASVAAVAPDHVREHLEAIGYIGSLALSDHQDLSRMEEKAMTDALTGIYNRRFLEVSLSHNVALANRTRAALSILMMDLDNFKIFNDTHGHQAGDALLEALGRHVRPLLRAEDVLARYGGEEFVAILPGAEMEIAVELGERVRHCVRGLLVPGLEDLPQPAVTISVGVASCPEDGMTAADLIRAADRALYAAKEDGRDRVATRATVKASIPPG